MHQHVLLYIKQGLEAYQKAFSPVIIIEDQYLQTFVHTLDQQKLPSSILLCPLSIRQIKYLNGEQRRPAF